MDTPAIIDKLIERLIKFAPGLIGLFLIVVLTTVTWLYYDLSPSVQPLSQAELLGAGFFWSMIVIPGAAICLFLQRRWAGICLATVGIWRWIATHASVFAAANAGIWHRIRRWKGDFKDEAQD